MTKQTNEGRLVKIETSLEYLKSNSDETKKNLTKFIEAADSKYATKSEVKRIEAQVSSNTSWIIKYGKDLAYLAAFVMLFAKTQGWV